MINEDIKLLIAKIDSLESLLRSNNGTANLAIGLLEELSSACSDLVETIDNYLEN
jgi:hypothetical protein